MRIAVDEHQLDSALSLLVEARGALMAPHRHGEVQSFALALHHAFRALQIVAPIEHPCVRGPIETICGVRRDDHSPLGRLTDTFVAAAETLAVRERAMVSRAIRYLAAFLGRAISNRRWEVSEKLGEAKGRAAAGESIDVFKTVGEYVAAHPIDFPDERYAPILDDDDRPDDRRPSSREIF